MRVIDLKKDLAAVYRARAGKVVEVGVPPLTYVAVDGVVAGGELPGESSAFANAVQALYAAVYTLKFSGKKRAADAVDFPVMALEGFWAGPGGTSFVPDASGGLEYTLGIIVPEIIDETALAAAWAEVERKRAMPRPPTLRVERIAEGQCVQALHVGPYATEPETMALMRAYAAEHGLCYRGRHHEIYLGDPRRAAPEKLRTLLRQPVASAR